MVILKSRGQSKKKSRIRETKHLSTDADSSTDAIGGWNKNTQKHDFFDKRKRSPKTQKLRNVQKYDKISDTPFDQRSLIHQEAWFPPCFVGQIIPRNPIIIEKRKKSSKLQKLKNVQKYDQISDMPFNQRGLIHREAWIPGGPRIPKHLIFLKNGKKSVPYFPQESGPCPLDWRIPIHSKVDIVIFQQS